MHASINLGAAAAAVGLAALALGQPAAAQDCPVEAEDAYAMTDEQVTALYACIEAAMAEAYAQGDNPVADAYRGWTVTGVRPGPDPTHGDRLLLTFANEIAAETYLAFAEEGVEMPVGGILAKESIAVANGQGRIGPLFIMEKLGLEAAPDTGGWSYTAVQPDGQMMNVPQSFCHDCHVNFEGQDSLAYPAAELRVAR